MNRRKKKKKMDKIRNGYTTSKRRKANRLLCERYPFLKMYNRFGKEIYWHGKRFCCTWADRFPKGWWKAFGIMLCEELREELVKHNFLEQYRIIEIKEKYGQLRIYDNGVPPDSNVWDIITKYSHLSENICIRCGEPDVPMINCYGWYSPYCFNCYASFSKNRKIDRAEMRQKYLDNVCEDSEYDWKMAKTYSVRTFSETEDIVVNTYDISETVDKIRENLGKNHG